MARQKETSAERTQKPASRLLSEPAAIMVPRLLFILSVIALIIMGLVMVYSASSITAYSQYNDAAYYIKRQALFLVIGLVACAALAKIPYTFWATPVVFVAAWVLSVVLLALTAFGLGVSALGAERSIVIAGFALQPAEFAKITLLVAVASLISMRAQGQIDGKKFIWLILIGTLVPLLLIYRQPDLGTAIILAIGFIAILLLAGVPWWIIFLIFGLLILYVIFACVTQPYHLERIVSVFNPWLDPQGAGYQSIQSLYAFGNGGIFGTGLGLSRQKYLYLPYAHTDFIFAIIGEELGLIGTVFVVCLFGLFIYAGMRICRNAPDLLGCMLAGGFTVMIGFQACVNMACVAGIAPVTGKALPFISYGGSSLIATLMMVGLVLSVSFKSKVGMAYERKRDDFLVIDGGEGSSDGQDHAHVAAAGKVIAIKNFLKPGAGSDADTGSGSRAGSGKAAGSSSSRSSGGGGGRGRSQGKGRTGDQASGSSRGRSSGSTRGSSSGSSRGRSGASSRGKTSGSSRGQSGSSSRGQSDASSRGRGQSGRGTQSTTRDGGSMRSRTSRSDSGDSSYSSRSSSRSRTQDSGEQPKGYASLKPKRPNPKR